MRGARCSAKSSRHAGQMARLRRKVLAGRVRLVKHPTEPVHAPTRVVAAAAAPWSAPVCFFYAVGEREGARSAAGSNKSADVASPSDPVGDGVMHL